MSLLRRLRRDNQSVPAPAASEDAPKPEELVPRSGTWNGLLFDNPNIGVPPALTWTFEFRFEDILRDDETSPVGVTVGWVPLPGADWTVMAGQTAAGKLFAEPIEPSVYFFEHYRYDAVELRVLEQESGTLRVAADIHGDVDGLDVASWSVDQQLEFEGIYVHLSDVETLIEASARLAAYTDVSRLVGATSGAAFLFADRRDD